MPGRYLAKDTSACTQEAAALGDMFGGRAEPTLVAASLVAALPPCTGTDDMGNRHKGTVSFNPGWLYSKGHSLALNKLI